MDRFTAALRRATRQKFQHMARFAYYFTDPAAPNPQMIRVIVTDRHVSVGDLKGTNFNYAEVDVDSPRIEFLREEVEPARKGFVSIEAGLAYEIDSTLPAEDITVTAKVVRLKAEKVRNFPYPQVAGEFDNHTAVPILVPTPGPVGDTGPPGPSGPPGPISEPPLETEGW